VCAKMVLRYKLSPTGKPCHIQGGFFKLWPNSFILPIAY
jgi:hypothetical protein